MLNVKTRPKGRIIFDTSYRPWSHTDEAKFDWTEYYPYFEEEILYAIPKSKEKSLIITVYVDADHAHDSVTQRLVTGILIFLNNTQIKWISKRQKIVETSTYASELVVAKIATELVLALRCQLRILGVKQDGPTMMYGDNQSVVLHTYVPSSILKRKHHICANHRVREAIAANIIHFKHITSTENYADLCSKPLGGTDVYNLTKPLLFKNQLVVENHCNSIRNRMVCKDWT